MDSEQMFNFLSLSKCLGVTEFCVICLLKVQICVFTNLFIHLKQKTPQQIIFHLKPGVLNLDYTLEPPGEP